MELLIGQIILEAYIAIALISTPALIATAPVVILNVLPTWADIVLAAGGVLNSPGSIHQSFKINGWLGKFEKNLLESEAKLYGVSDNSSQNPA